MVPPALGLLLAASPALHAQDYRAWQAMYEGLLRESADGDTEAAYQWYEGLLRGLTEAGGGQDDPTLAELRFWLGRSAYALGDVEGARQALATAMTDPRMRARAQALLGQIDAEEVQVRSLPLYQDFSDDTGHWLHGWRHADAGRIYVAPAPPNDEPAMAWETRVTEGAYDEVFVRFDLDRVAPRGFRLSLRSSLFPAMVLPAVIDTRGRRYTLAEPVVVPTDRWIGLDLPLSKFLPLEGSNWPARLTPDRVDTFALQDVTAFYSTERQRHVIWVDEVYIY